MLQRLGAKSPAREGEERKKKLGQGSNCYSIWGAEERGKELGQGSKGYSVWGAKSPGGEGKERGKEPGQGPTGRGAPTLLPARPPSLSQPLLTHQYSNADRILLVVLPSHSPDLLPPRHHHQDDMFVPLITTTKILLI